MFRCTTIYAFLLLCVVAMHTVTHSLILPGFEIAQLQTSLSEHCDPAGSISSLDGHELDWDGDYKPPKHSFIDYSTFLAPRCLLHAYNPRVTDLPLYEPFQAPPEVYLEIDVPPDHA